MGRLGIFGSSFNPPTLGHSVLVGEAAWRLSLEKVIVVPTGDAWHKVTDTAPAPEDRLALARAAFGSAKGAEVSALELDRDGPSYTCDTLEEIHSSNPDSQLLFLAGSDAALGIGDWHRPDRVLELAGFGVALRSGADRGLVEAAFEALDAGDRVEFFEMPRIEVSSTMVRERIAAGQPWRHLVAHEVAEMIENEELYGSKQ